MFRSTTRKVAAGALAATAIATAFTLSIPSYAEDAYATDTPVEVATADGPGVMFRMHGGPGAPGGFGVPFGEGLFATFDTDGDGEVTQAEIDAARAEELETYDTNGDGVLSLEEYIVLLTDKMRERLVDAFQRLDADGDGSITAEEFNMLGDIVARLDSNGDGALSEEDRPARDEVRPFERQGGPGGPAEDGLRGSNGGPSNSR